MPLKTRVLLSEEERTALIERTTSGTAPARTLTRARILLKADESTEGAAWTDQQIADALEVGIATVCRVRKRYAKRGALAATENKVPERVYERIFDGATEARLVQLACTKPPEGQASWTLGLLADRMVELGHVESVSRETVRRVLKKTKSSPGRAISG